MLDELDDFTRRSIAVNDSLQRLQYVSSQDWYEDTSEIHGDCWHVAWAEEMREACADLRARLQSWHDTPRRGELLRLIEEANIEHISPTAVEEETAITYHERVADAAAAWLGLLDGPDGLVTHVCTDTSDDAVEVSGTIECELDPTPDCDTAIKVENRHARRWLERNGNGATDTPEPPAVLPPVVRFHDLELNIATWELKNCATGAEQDLGKSEGPQGPLCQLLIEAGGSSIMRSDAAAYVYKVPVGEVDDPLKQALDKACERLQIKLRRFGFDVEKNNGRWRLVEKQK